VVEETKILGSAVSSVQSEVATTVVQEKLLCPPNVDLVVISTHVCCGCSFILHLVDPTKFDCATPKKKLCLILTLQLVYYD
jgi:hypothetical protein